MKQSIKYNKFVSELYKEFEDNENTNFVFICIGTSKLIGDSFGPFVGENLKKHNILKNNKTKKLKINIYGDIENNVNFRNINKLIDEINYKYYNPFIITVDSALSTRENIGKIVVSKRNIEIGKAINKKQKCIGNISVRGIVGENYNKLNKNMRGLKMVALENICELSNIVSNGICDVIDYKYKI